MDKKTLHIVKIGGNVIDNPKVLTSFLKDFSKLEGLKILVHGGGKKATEMASNLGLKSTMVDGRRVTNKENLDVVTMVYAGLLNKNITALLQQNNCNALGLSGADANCIQAHKRIVKEIDYGFVGDIDKVNVRTLKLFLENDIVPVFCAITHNKEGQLLNTNADTIASELASELASIYNVVLMYCFEKDGVLEELNNDDSVIENINTEKYEQLKLKGVITDGMLPKLENCFDALHKGVTKVIIGNPSIIKIENQKYTTLVV